MKRITITLTEDQLIGIGGALAYIREAYYGENDEKTAFYLRIEKKIKDALVNGES